MTRSAGNEVLHRLVTCRRGLREYAFDDTVVCGFDGFVDTIRHPIEAREGADSIRRIDRLESFGERIRASGADGNSLSIEWKTAATRTGGHTAHLARAFGTVGFTPVMIGTYGTPPLKLFIDEFGEHEIRSLGDPGRTDAVEFSNGKLLLIERNASLSLDWERVCETVDPETFAQYLDDARLFTAGYLAGIPRLPELLDGMRTDVLGRCESPPAGVLVDPGDVRSLETKRLDAGIEAMRRLDGHVPLTLSANRAEIHELAERCLQTADGGSFARTVETLQAELGLTRIVGHGSEESVLSTDTGSWSAPVVPVDTPAQSTGAGDHFNVGLSLGILGGLADKNALLLGNVVASHFVEMGQPPTPQEIDDRLVSWERHLRQHD